VLSAARKAKFWRCTWPVDTDLVRAIDSPKTSPEDIVKRALDRLESCLDEVLADERTRLVKQGLTAARPSYLPQNA
jgi:hypothetical protein